MNLQTLFQSYGWQLALVGLIGTFLVGWLKTPLNYILKKGTSTSADANFDTAAFLLGFGLAVVLGCVYTAIASGSGWLYNVGEDGTREVIKADFSLYLSNGFGTWLYQIAYYQLWKKLGIKRFLALVWSKFKVVLDKNNDGNIDLEEASSFVTGLLKDGKLNIEEVLSTLSVIAPSVAQEVISSVDEEFGVDGAIDVENSLDYLQQLLEQAMSKLPNEKLSSLATELSEKLADKAKEVVDNPVDVADSANLYGANDIPPIKPVIKF